MFVQKKKILIVNKSFELGGIQTALANMLQVINNEYDISLAVFNPHGPLKEKTPENVKILKLSPLTEVLGMTKADCKKYGSFVQRIFKFSASVWAKVFSNSLPVNIALFFQKPVGEFDAVISYHQETRSDTMVTGFGKFALKKCDSPLKIAWIHADFLATKLATKKNLKTYRKFDKIISVSNTTMNNFIKAYPELKEKCGYCYNYVSSNEILEKSQSLSNVYQRKDNEIILFSACRLVEEKGIIPAIENLMPLFKSGDRIKWYIAGDGPLKNNIEKILCDNNIESKVVLLGYKENPYPYIREADFLFLPSLHETFSMVISEAHILKTPVIASDIPVMREVTNETDYLCENGDFIKIIADNCTKKSTKSPVVINEIQWSEQFRKVIS